MKPLRQNDNFPVMPSFPLESVHVNAWGQLSPCREAILVLAEMVRHYDLLLDKRHTPDLVGWLNLRSRNGVKVRLLSRAKGLLEQ